MVLPVHPLVLAPAQGQGPPLQAPRLYMLPPRGNNQGQNLQPLQHVPLVALPAPQGQAPLYVPAPQGQGHSPPQGFGQGSPQAAQPHSEGSEADLVIDIPDSPRAETPTQPSEQQVPLDLSSGKV